MLTPEALQRLQQYNFDLLAREEPNGRRRLRYIALAHLKDGKSFTEVAAACVPPVIPSHAGRNGSNAMASRVWVASPATGVISDCHGIRKKRFGWPSSSCSRHVLAVASAVKTSVNCWRNTLMWPTR